MHFKRGQFKEGWGRKKFRSNFFHLSLLTPPSPVKIRGMMFDVGRPQVAMHRNLMRIKAAQLIKFIWRETTICTAWHSPLVSSVLVKSLLNSSWNRNQLEILT